METTYLKTHIGDCLAVCLCEVTEQRPDDPIEFIAHWLYSHKHNYTCQEEQYPETERMRMVRSKEERKKELQLRNKIKHAAARVFALEKLTKRELLRKLKD